MKLKTRMLLKLIFIFAAAAVLIAAGVMRNRLLADMGAAMLLCGAVLAVKFFRTARNCQKLEELENSVKDERIAFVAGKSYTFAFWLSIIAEFCASCTLLFFNMDSYAVILDYVMCFQAVLYSAAYLFYSKKY